MRKLAASSDITVAVSPTRALEGASRAGETGGIPLPVIVVGAIVLVALGALDGRKL